MGHRNSALGWGHAVHAAAEGQVPRAGHRSLAFWSSRAGRTSSFPRAAVAAGLFGQQGTLRARWVRPKHGACGVLGCTKLPAPRLNPLMLQRSTTHSTAPAAGTGPDCQPACPSSPGWFQTFSRVLPRLPVCTSGNGMVPAPPPRSLAGVPRISSLRKALRVNFFPVKSSDVFGSPSDRNSFFLLH